MSIFKEAVQIFAPQKSKFDMSHEKKLSCDMGRLVPIMVQEILPGDSFRVDTELMVRFAPMLAPLYHRLDVFTHFFYVPNRIIWNEWETFITGGPDGLQAPIHPAITVNGAPNVTGSLLDYMGIPAQAANITGSLVVNALPLRAYLEIYNQYYRDENIIPEIAYTKASGVIANGSAEYLKLVELRKRAWEKDYFTTAMSTAQKGNPAAAPVAYTPNTYSVSKGALTNTPTVSATGFITAADGKLASNPGSVGARIETEANVLVSEMRKAARLQEFLEAAQRGGHRLTEWVLHVFGVKSSDARLQRPEYLGGGKTPVTISEVLSTYQNSAATPNYAQGNMSGHGIGVGDTHGFSREFEEHGFVIGIMSVVPKANYYQGVEKMWKRPTRFDYYIPQFAHLGEQPVLNEELYFDLAGGTNANTFGYQSRYAEYKFKLSTIHGQFRETLAYWHMARKFSATPGLNQTFIECVPTKDIFPIITASDHPLFVQIHHTVSALRPLPYFSNPKL